VLFVQFYDIVNKKTESDTKMTQHHLQSTNETELKAQRDSIRNLLKTSTFAPPTVILSILCPLTLVFNFYNLTQHELSRAGLILVFLSNTIACYLSFTPMHDAVHGSAARKKFWNHACGRLSGWCLFAPYAMFRFCHLNHHSFTNVGHKDPDHYSGSGKKWLLPLRWATQDIFYYYFTVRTLIHNRKKETFLKEDKFFENEMLKAFAFNILNVLLIAYLANYFNIFLDVLLFWVLPVRIAVFLLSFGFDFLPHIPHNVPVSLSRYKTTSIWDSFALSIPLCNQNYHAMHHLYPAAPFYKYHKLYFALQKDVEKNGTPIFKGFFRKRIQISSAKTTP
jgi:beta-carotene hydroxylase